MALALLLVSGLFFSGAMIRFLSTQHEGIGHGVEVWWPADDPGEGAALLTAAGVLDSPRAFRFTLWLSRPFVRPEPGPHLLRDDLSPAEVLRRLARLSSRSRARVVIPEGWTRFQIAERLESLAVCSRRAFDVGSTDRGALARLGITGDSAEGYLFPATYDLPADTTADAVVSEMVDVTRIHLASLHAKHTAGFQRLSEKYQWGDRETLTLASIVEREAARADEQPMIASVFFNRLDSADFKPQRTLQSDPTAAYGCALFASLESCRGYSGRVTPEMLRDAGNPYNTYRHAGLPPGPIGNPGEHAILAVLEPAVTEFLFFVASGDGRHTFTRSFEDHDAAIRKNGR